MGKESFEEALTQVMAAYRKLPTDQLVSDTIIHTRDDADAIRWAAAAVLGFSRSGYYLDTARSLMDQLMQDATEISWRMNAYDLMFGDLKQRYHDGQRPLAGVERATNFRLGAQYLTIFAEVLWHFYAVSLQRSWHFMANSARGVDPAFAPTTGEANYLELIRAFRNHMEHRDKATRDIGSHDWQSMSKAEQHTITVGYRRDYQNNIRFVPVEKGPLVGKEQKMPINPVGFERFETMLIAAYERLKHTCLGQLEQHFLAHPDQLPSLDQVGGTLTDSMEPVERVEE